MKNPNGKFGDPERSPQEARISKEEMNIAEYPITLLSRTVPKGLRKIEYMDWITIGGKQKQVRWVVSGSEDHGLPIGGDQDIYMAVMETWRKQGFMGREIRIESIYQVLKEIGLSDNKQNYDRFKKALDRLTGIFITTENAFWDKEGKGYMEKRGFHLFDGYRYSEKEDNNGEVTLTSALCIRVSEELYQSVANGYIKETDIDFYFSLSSPLPKRIYRYLDKKKYGNVVFSMEIYKFANKIGILAGGSKKYYPSQLKEILTPAFDELKEKRFLKDYEYQKTSDSTNEKIIFVFEETSHQTKNRLPFKGSDDDYWISPFVEDIISLTGAEHSKAWYVRTLRILGQERSRNLIYYALSLTKEAMHLGEIRTSKDQYFISTLKRLCQESGFEI